MVKNYSNAVNARRSHEVSGDLDKTIVLAWEKTSKVVLYLVAFLLSLVSKPSLH